jgi:gluconate 2-dehydrogenase gamma chain
LNASLLSNTFLRAPWSKKRPFFCRGSLCIVTAMSKRRTNINEVSRRSVLAGATLVPLINGIAQGAASVFSPEQKQLLEAFVDRLIPTDESGPGAVECGVVNYVDKALAGDLAGEKAAMLAGFASTDAFARSKHGMGFAELAAEQKDELLIAIESNNAPGFLPNSRAFFVRVRQLTLEGMFSDPFYGGNRGFRGWDLIRYPGPRLAVSEKEQELRVPIKPLRTSSYGAKRGN